MKKMQKWLQFTNTFSFSKQDKRGLLVLLSLIFTTLIFRIYYPFWLVAQNNPKDSDISFADSFKIQDSLAGEKTLTAAAWKYEKTSTSSSSQNNEKMPSPSPRKYTPPAYVDKKISIRINEADTMDLQELRGIGAAYARRIYAYRERLGGFVKKEQLMEVWGIDSTLYLKIAPYIQMQPLKIKKHNINQVDVQSLKKHPYLDYYQAKEIVKYREKYGAFSSVEDIKAVHLMDRETYVRVKDYLCVSSEASGD